MREAFILTTLLGEEGMKRACSVLCCSEESERAREEALTSRACYREMGKRRLRFDLLKC